MNILFLTCNGIEDAAFGGAKASARNYELLKKHGNVEVITVQKISNISSAFSAFRGYFPPVGKRDLKAVKKKLSAKEYDFVFFDGSHFGKILKYVSERGIKTICFFHNCEYDYIEVRFGKGNSLQKRLYKKIIAQQEGLSAYYAGCSMAFTQRDALRIAQLYGVDSPVVVPLSLVDIYRIGRPVKGGKECLLFGARGRANEEAFAWFVKRVSPYLKCRTRIAGMGFEACKEKWSSDKVVVQGQVDDVAQLYTNAVCVAIPLMSGGGMKIKTAEAMMFGKHIFGTREAFEGYGQDAERVGAECNSADEFIDKINELLDGGADAYNSGSRQLYVEKYSLQATRKRFDGILKEYIQTGTLEKAPEMREA